MTSGEVWMLIWRSGRSSATRLVSHRSEGSRIPPTDPAMRTLVLAVGRLRPPFADDVQHYQRLLARHAKVQVIELREDEHVERRIPEDAFVCLLDATGDPLDSME